LPACTGPIAGKPAPKAGSAAEPVAAASAAKQAPSLAFIERLENPPEFPDADPAGGLKALVFRQI